jgi:hypothetical protein
LRMLRPPMPLSKTPMGSALDKPKVARFSPQSREYS